MHCHAQGSSARAAAAEEEEEEEECIDTDELLSESIATRKKRECEAADPHLNTGILLPPRGARHSRNTAETRTRAK